MNQYHYHLALACLLLLARPAHLFAQTDYRSAEIQLQDGTQLKGQVDYPYWTEGTDRLLFRDNEEANARFIPTAEVEQLLLPGEPEERFYGRVRRRLDYSAQPGAVPRTDTLAYVKDTMLLQVVVLGTANLYYFESQDGTPHYFLQKGGEMEELVQHRYLLQGKSRQLRKRHNRYRQQLAEALGDCPEVAKRLPEFELKGDNLFELLVEYNTCSETQELDYSLLPPKPSWSIGALAGIAFTRVSRKSLQLEELSTGTWLPRLGITAILHLPNSNGRSGFVFEGRYAPFQTEDPIDGITVDLDYAQFSFGLRKSGNANVFGNATIGFSYAMEISNGTLSGLPDNVFSPNLVGLFGGVGLGGDHFEVNLRYEINNAGLLLSSAPGYISNTLEIWAAYRL